MTKRKARGVGTAGDVGRLSGILCLAIVMMSCTPDETVDPLEPSAASEISNSNGWWWNRTLRIDPASLTIVAGDTRRVSAEVSSVVGDTVTISLKLMDKDSVVRPIDPSEWSIDFDPTHLSISEDFLVTALAPTPPGSTTSVVVKHIDTERTAEVGVTVLPEKVGAANEPDGWPNNEPAGMTPIHAVDGSSKNWPSFQQYDAWQDDSRVAVVNDPDSKYGLAVEKRFFAGLAGGWHGITSSGNFGDGVEELYIRTVFRLSANWQWHTAGSKLLYYGAAGRSRYESPTQFVLGVHRNGTVFWTSTGDGRHTPNGIPELARDVYHTIELHHVASTSGANGSLRMWVDGVEVQSFDAINDPTQNEVQFISREWSPTRFMANKRLGGMQAFMHWGGQNDVKRANDWVRISELYVSGRY